MKTKKELIQKLIDEEVLKTEKIIDSFRFIDRANFVLDKYAPDVYEDYPLSIGEGQTISQPYTVAFMLELLEPQEGENILDVGSGSGWTTALLANIVGDQGNVKGVEIISELVEFGNENIKKYNFPGATIEQAKVNYGLSEYAPYDKILVSATGDEIPEELIKQLKVGGKMVIPINDEIILLTKTSEKENRTEHFFGFNFVPLIKL